MPFDLKNNLVGKYSVFALRENIQYSVFELRSVLSLFLIILFLVCKWISLGGFLPWSVTLACNMQAMKNYLNFQDQLFVV